jgi:TIR domain
LRYGCEEPVVACKIFLNYRRGDDPGFVHALLSQLEKTFPPEQVFMDVDSIAPGIDFVEVLDEQIARCAVMLALIGRGWLDAKDASGQRLLDKADDFVRIEIVSALRHGKRVIPVLLHGAEMPRAEALPKPLKPLARAAMQCD